MEDTSEKVRSFWNSRAGLEQSAGTRDLIAKQLEIEAIARHISDGLTVLDVGCGNGLTAIELAKRYAVTVVGFDNAEQMIAAAKEQSAGVEMKGTVEFFVGDVLAIPDHRESYDVVYSERALINLPDWPRQQMAIRKILTCLRKGGRYVMCENSSDGLGKINALRCQAGLEEIVPPWHNRYFRDEELNRFSPEGAELECKEQFSSTYYFLSRVVNAWLSKMEGTEPTYDAPINQLALKLGSFGDIGQTCIWVWKKIG